MTSNERTSRTTSKGGAAAAVALQCTGLIAAACVALACASDGAAGGGEGEGAGQGEAKVAPEASERPGNKAGFDSGIPTLRTAMKVVAVRERGPYLVADLGFSGSRMQAWVAPSDACRSVFGVGEDVRYVNSGPLGVYRRGEQECQLLGVGNLELWRDRNSRSSARGVPRRQASYRVLARDAEGTLLEGSFPLAGYVGFTGGLDYVAAVADSELCAGPVEKGVASMEYRGKGERALSLVGSTGLCRIEALAMPLR